MKYKCLLTRKFWPQDIEFLKRRVPDEIEFVCPDDWTNEALIRLAEDADVFLGTLPDPSVFRIAKKLKFAQVPWTGLDAINFEPYYDVKVPICNSHGNSDSVAELALTLLLSVIKMIPQHDQDMRNGNWRRPGAEDCIFPQMLRALKVGLLGYGHIAKKLHDLLKPFAVDVQAVATKARKEEDIPVRAVSELDAVCAWADILVVTLPLTVMTKGLIGKQQLLLLGKKSFLINVSRAQVIDEEALFVALSNHTIAGAGLDVWYVEPPRGVTKSTCGHFPFELLKNIILSPHRGGMVRGELPHMTDVVINLTRLVEGNAPINSINTRKGY